MGLSVLMRWRAETDDPDLDHEDDIEEDEGTSAGYLQQQRDLLFSQASESGRG